MTTYKLIHQQQQEWATRQGIKFDNDGYTLSLNDNLFIPMSTEVLSEFNAGSGSELGNGIKRGKMQALHSSSALVLNFFQYWRGHNIDLIGQACGARKGMTELRFERTHATPLGGIPPHLDAEFHGAGLIPVAIEAKFTETYRRKTRRVIKDKYLNHTGLWTQLPGCGKLAGRIKQEEKGRTSFSYLDAPQLLKHILGLSTDFGVNGFNLLYLWYEVPSTEADRHKEELRLFKQYIKDEVHFRDTTCQDIFRVINQSTGSEQAFLRYLSERYFSL